MAEAGVNFALESLYQAKKSSGGTVKALKSKVSRAGVYKTARRYWRTGNTHPPKTSSTRTGRTLKLIKVPG